MSPHFSNRGGAWVRPIQASDTRRHPRGGYRNGAVKPGDRFDSNDFRASNPRFSADNLATNLEPVAPLAELAADKGCRPGQLALAWLLAQPLDVVPIPGTKRVAYARENLAATSVAISTDEVAYLSNIFAPGQIVGERYTAAHARTVANRTAGDHE